MSLLLESRFQEDGDLVLSTDAFLQIQQVCTGLIIGDLTNHSRCPANREGRGGGKSVARERDKAKFDLWVHR